MIVDIKIPVMGESVSTATVSSLLLASGALVVAGQELVEIETDKVNQVLTAEVGGRVTFSVAVGANVNIGDKIGEIDTSVIPVEEPTPFVKQKEEEVVVVEPLDSLPKKEETRHRMTGLRKTIASKLVEVKNKTAMLTTFNEVDMSGVMEIRDKEKDRFLERHGVKLGFMSFFVKATVVALKSYPLLNSYIEGDDIVTPTSYSIGVAVSTDKGLFVPVIHNAQDKSFGEIEKEIALQAKKAREGTVAVDDLQGGTFTITNGGVFGSLFSTPILNPPQSGILGMHAICKRPVVVGEQIAIRPMMYLALSYDHRIIDGKEAVLFLKNIKESLENPSKLLLDL